MKKLIALSLVIIPFYEVILYFIIPGRTYPVFPNMEYTKDFVCLVLSLMIGLFALNRNGFKPVKEPLILCFFVFLIFNIFKIPNANVPLGPANLNGMWNHFPVIQCLIFFILFLGIINSDEINTLFLINICHIISWCGAFMAGYMILQFFGVDQIFNLASEKVIKGVTNPSVGGTIGQPTLSAPFIVMALPFTLMFRKKTLAVISSLGVIVSGSAIAIASLVCVFGLWIIHVYGRLTKKNIITFFGFVLILGLYLISRKIDFLTDNGRFGVWASTIQKIFNDKIILSGAGIGAYKFLFGIRNNSPFHHAHNEYLQALFSIGIIGSTLIFLFIRKLINRALIVMNDDIVIIYILLSLISLFICAAGTFIFQLAPYQFYGVVLLGLMYKLTREVNYV